MELLELEHVSRRISSEFSLRDISLTLKQGQVHALVGRNASGKSTVLSVLMGIHPADSGIIRIRGRQVEIREPKDAGENGIMLISQNQQMFPNLRVYENIYFGRELTVGGSVRMLSNRKMIESVEAAFQSMHANISPMCTYGSLTPSERQLAAIVRALVSHADMILLDEPSTHLNPEEKKRLYEAVAALRQQGCSFLIVSHDPDEVLTLADEVSVVEDGCIVRTAPIGEFDKPALIEAAYGVKTADLYWRVRVEPGEELMRAEHLSGDGFQDVSFSLRKGELAVLLGNAKSGKLELAGALAGLEKRTGKLTVSGAELPAEAPLATVRAGLVLASSEQDEEVFRECETVTDAGGKDSPLGRMSLAMKLFASGMSKTFGAYVGVRQNKEYVTGGNRQRELMERALRKQALVYILCEPSAGVDAPARMHLYDQIGRLLQKGAAVLLLTADPDEALGLADRVLVLQSGQLTLDRESAGLTKGQLEAAVAE